MSCSLRRARRHSPIRCWRKPPQQPAPPSQRPPKRLASHLPSPLRLLRAHLRLRLWIPRQRRLHRPPPLRHRSLWRRQRRAPLCLTLPRQLCSVLLMLTLLRRLRSMLLMLTLRRQLRSMLLTLTLRRRPRREHLNLTMLRQRTLRLPR